MACIPKASVPVVSIIIRNPSRRASLRSINSDELKNFELGIKSQFLDNRMQLNATLFHIDWSDIQVEPRDPAGNIPFTVNGGDAEINGLEWGLTSLLTDSLRLTFTGTYFFKHELTSDQPDIARSAAPSVIRGLDGR